MNCGRHRTTRHRRPSPPTTRCTAPTEDAPRAMTRHRRARRRRAQRRSPSRPTTSASLGRLHGPGHPRAPASPGALSALTVIGTPTTHSLHQPSCVFFKSFQCFIIVRVPPTGQEGSLHPFSHVEVHVIPGDETPPRPATPRSASLPKPVTHISQPRPAPRARPTRERQRHPAR